MMPQKKRVLISGAGVAGMACASMLDTAQYEVDLIERASGFRNIGYSIVLWRCGFLPLKALLERNGSRLKEGSDFFRLDGLKLFGGRRLRPLREFDTRGYGWTMKRQRLMELLEDVLRTRLPDERIRFSCTIERIDYPYAGGPARVTFHDGTQATYDIVIVAEGIHASSRALIGVRSRIQTKPYALRYAWFSSPTALDTYGALFLAPGHIGVVHPPDAANLLGYYFDKAMPATEQRAFENAVRTCIKQPAGQDSTIDMEASDVFELEEIHLDRYCAGSVVLIGDAAHGRPPTIGFGTSLALEDAVLLAQTLNALDGSDSGASERALCVYSAARMPRVESVYRLQGMLELFYTKNSVWAALLTLAARSSLGRYFEMRMKQLASFDEISVE